MARVLPFAMLVLVLVHPVIAEDEDPGRLYDAALAAEEARDFGRALRLYEKILDIDEEHEDTLERWEACEKLVEWQSTVKGEPTAADLVRLGEVHAMLGRPKDEEAAYEEAISLDPDYPDAHGHRALLHYAGRGFRGSMLTVIRETQRLLETSPHRDRLKQALADFSIYGELRLFTTIQHEVLAAARKAARDGKPAEAAAIYEKAAAGEVPDAFRTVFLVEAGKARITAGDEAGARRAFALALTHAKHSYTVVAHLRLAALDLGAGEATKALEHLRAAVREGGTACRAIAKGRETTYEALFSSADPAVRAEMERLADEEEGDAPIRAALQAAVDRAKKEGKLVLLHWYGPYCPFVMAMEERLAHPDVRKLIEEKFVHYRMDYGAHHRGMTLDREYGEVFAEHGVPSFYVLNPDGSLHSIQKDVPLMNPAHRSYDVEKILAWLRSVEPE